MEISLAHGEFLVRLARRTVELYLSSDMSAKMAPPKDTPKELWERRGVFVTINSRGASGKYDQLRGCIGFPYPILPAVNATIEAAIAAATEDPRFYPLSLDELGEVTFEVSVLTVPEELKISKDQLPSAIAVGKDGLIVERGTSSGLLLPQVAVEYGWNSEQFLDEACAKAGLPYGAWREEGTKVLTFRALVFREQEPMGTVVEEMS